jgi:hypothetical protein
MPAPLDLTPMRTSSMVEYDVPHMGRSRPSRRRPGRAHAGKASSGRNGRPAQSEVYVGRRGMSGSAVLDVDAHMCSLPDYSFTVVEHDAERPWIVVSQEHKMVTLDAGKSCFAWALAHQLALARPRLQHSLD